MNPYTSARSIVHGLSVAVSSALGLYAKSWLETNIKDGPLFLLLVAIIVIAFYLAQYFFSALLNKVTMLRRLCFRHYDVEGTWVDLVLEDDFVVGLTFIKISDYGVQWSGTNYDQEKRVRSTFRTQACVVDWPAIRFWCRDEPLGPSGALDKACELSFSPNSKFPQRYAGFTSHPDRKPTRLVGKRITDPEHLKDLHSSSPEERLFELARTFPEFPPE